MATNEHIAASTPDGQTGVPDFLSIAEVPRHFPLTPWQVRTAIWSGKIPARQVGKRLVLYKPDIVRFLLARPKVRHGRCPTRGRAA